jgi:hypothetical protein
MCKFCLPRLRWKWAEHFARTLSFGFQQFRYLRSAGAAWVAARKEISRSRRKFFRVEDIVVTTTGFGERTDLQLAGACAVLGDALRNCQPRSASKDSRCRPVSTCRAWSLPRPETNERRRVASFAAYVDPAAIREAFLSEGLPASFLEIDGGFTVGIPASVTADRVLDLVTAIQDAARSRKAC